MRYQDWEPHYLGILAEFGFEGQRDEAAARLLEALLPPARLCDDACLSRAIGKDVTVCGDAACLEADLERMGATGTVMSADGATGRVMSLGIVPGLVVTDLDGEVSSQARANQLGAVAVIHAHGDNQEALALHLHRFQGLLVGTAQCRPFGRLRNFGGFTDGDRAVMLARHFGATRIRLLGFDFLAPREKEGREASVKLRKLEVARRMIFDLNPPGTCLSIP